MKEVIDRIYKRTTEYSHPSQATTIANSLELLSSGIYTEEERFVFELLQNAVDSFDERTGALDVRIIVGNGQLVFMHTGKPFSERDLEGLCDIGNGNKMSDAKKIGYKGIGFKSVFMHSKRVTVITGNTCFRLDEEACKEIASKRGGDYHGVKMPWQIIPILSDIPKGLDYDDYSVATILEVTNTGKLLKKVERLLSDARFLLFLKVGNLRVSLFDNDRELLSLSKTQEGNILTLAKNEVAQSRWLMFAEDVEIPAEVKEDLIHDAKTPSKLKDSNSVEISFAIALDDNGKIIPLKDAVVYTYLPTSFSFGFEFVVNANFITDAGRQQLIKDCEWNKFIFSQIPGLFLNWVRTVLTSSYTDWHKVMLPMISAENELASCYKRALDHAIYTIPFVRTISGNQIYLKDAIVDERELSNALPTKIYNKWVSKHFSSGASKETIVEMAVGTSLSAFGLNRIGLSLVDNFLQHGTEYIVTFSDKEWSKFIQWVSQLENKKLGEYPILPNETKIPTPALKLFFPSTYKDENSMAKDTQTINSEVYSLLDDNTKRWLTEIGVKEMDNRAVIENVLCESGYITKNNSIDVIRFIFDADKKDHIIDKLPLSKKKNIKVLTSSNTLAYIDNTFLDASYGTDLRLPIEDTEGVFISKEYIRRTDNLLDWQLFFRRLGANTDIEVSKRSFDKDSNLYQELYSYVEYCSRHEKNYGYSIHTFGYFVHRYISAKLPPLIELWNKYEWSKLIWGTVLAHPISIERKDDYIAGHTGFNNYAYGYLVDNVDGHRYLGKYLIQHLTETKSILPGTDGHLHKANSLFAPTERINKIVGKYLPTLFVRGSLDPSWDNILNLKKDLKLEDYLTLLAKIAEDDSKISIADNIERICSIYEQIADGGYNLKEGSSDFNILRNWGKCHKILSSEKEFEYPSDLYLLSSRLSGVELANQVYHWKNQENNRFADLMIAMGVNMINDHRVEGLEHAEAETSVRDELSKRVEFFTVLTLKDNDTIKEWEDALQRIRTAIAKIIFFKVPSIQVVYGNQHIEKKVYVKDSNLYFVGKFGLAIQELLHADIVRLLGLHTSDRSVFLTLMRMMDHEEMIEYLQMKGYNTQYISAPQLPVIPVNVPVASMGGEEASFGGLTTEQMRDALTEAKDTVLRQLEMDGYDISDSKWDGWTCIDGVTKGATEFPLVIRSNKSGSNIRLNSTDWNQLMKPNAIFAMNTSDGIGTLNLKDVLKSRENITVRFKSDNIDKVEHVSKIANLLAYFRGIQFDFESYVRPAISRWQSFLAPELETGEQASANPNVSLPE